MSIVGMEKNKINRTLGVLLIVIVLAFAVVMMLQLSSIVLGPSKSACTKKVCLAKFLEGPPAFNDQGLKTFIGQRFFVESDGPPAYTTKKGFDADLEEALSFVKKHFENKKNGVFVVLGAGDGEYQDLSLPLENELGWTGLLVEPHPELFVAMKNKGRKATLASNCISPYAYPAITVLSHPTISKGDTEEVKLSKYRRTKVKQLFEDDTDVDDLRIQCLPLENVLYAAGLETKVDLLLMDMSGSDLDVIINVRLDVLPDVEMLIMRTHPGQASTNQGSDIGGYFLDNNLVLKKVIGQKEDNKIYIMTKFREEL